MLQHAEPQPSLSCQCSARLACLPPDGTGTVQVTTQCKLTHSGGCRRQGPGLYIYPFDCLDDLSWASFGETDILLLDFTVYTVPAHGHFHRTRTRTRIDIDVETWTPGVIYTQLFIL